LIQSPSQDLNAKLPRLLWPAIMTAAMLAVLLGLGTWQVRRLHWKLGLLAQIARAEAAPPVPLVAEPDPYTKVQVTGRLRDDLAVLYGAEVRDLPKGPALGAQLIEPLEREGHDTILVDRGWVPGSHPNAVAQPDGPVTIEGFIQPGAKPGLFSATDDAVGRRFYTLDPAAIATAVGLKHVAPFTLIATGPAPPGGYPDPARHLPRPPNNHLSYAITWYGLAIALVAVFVLWSRKVLMA
jgi:surfeit locus 1 family protein